MFGAGVAMSDEEAKKSWWHTLPGLLTGITATITALAGLLVAINQTGWFKDSTPEPPAVEAMVAPSAAVPSTTGSDNPASNTPATVSMSDSKAVIASGQPSVELPSLRDYRFGDLVFSVLAGSIAPRTTETATLALNIRLLNNSKYPSNFWDSQFRLIVDGIPRAPDSNLNKVVNGNSADEGQVTFVVPKNVSAAQLRLIVGEEQTDIPLQLIRG
jgi:hypothetical protein